MEEVRRYDLFTNSEHAIWGGWTHMDSPVFDRCRWDEIPPDEEDVFGWATDLFGVASYALQLATPEWRFLVRIENKPVVHIAVLRRTVTVAGRDKPVGGISRLVTVPQVRTDRFHFDGCGSETEKRKDIPDMFCEFLLEHANEKCVPGQ